jgi:hypothetical protein
MAIENERSSREKNPNPAESKAGPITRELSLSPRKDYADEDLPRLFTPESRDGSSKNEQPHEGNDRGSDRADFGNSPGGAPSDASASPSRPVPLIPSSRSVSRLDVVNVFKTTGIRATKVIDESNSKNF